MKKKKIFICFGICLLILLLHKGIYAYTTDRFLDQDEYKKYICYNTDKVISGFKKSGFTVKNTGFATAKKISKEGVLKAAYNKCDELGLNYSKAQDKYVLGGSSAATSVWYNGDNDLKVMEEPFPPTMFGKFTSRRTYFQWTYNNTMYIAWIYIEYSGTSWGNPMIVIFTNDTINKKLYDKSEQEKQEEKRKTYENAWKTVPGINAEYTVIVDYVLSDFNYNEAKGMKKLASSDDGIKKLKKWKETIGTHNGDREGTVKGYITKLIECDKDTNKINETTKNYNDSMKEIGKKIYTSTLHTKPGENRTENVFTDDVLDNIGDYKPGNIDGTSAGKIETATSKILTVISNIGIAVSVIVLAVLGIKYMLGSVEEKAEYKEGLVPYVIGAFILFGITTFVKILMAFGDKIANI